MSSSVFRLRPSHFLGCGAMISLLGFGTAATGQTKLPELVVSAPKQKPKVGRAQTRVAPAPASAQRVTPAAAQPVTPGAQLNAKADAFDQARSNLYTTIGTTSATISQSTIQALPGGDNQPVEKILLQTPGVSQDSAASGTLHVRNDHANVQLPHQWDHAAR